MDWLEEELKLALARKEPSPDFAARVRARTRPRPVFYMRRWPVAAAAALFVATGSGIAWRHHEGVVAKERVMLALRITADKLNRIQTHVREMNP